LSGSAGRDRSSGGEEVEQFADPMVGFQWMPEMQVE
jgi:hypothetical protein